MRREYYQAHREELLIKRREYYQRNKQCVKERERKRYLRNRDKILAYVKGHAETHRGHIRDYHKRWRENNREVLLPKKRAYHHANRDRILKSKNEYSKAHREEINRKSKEYSLKHPEVGLQTMAKRRALKRHTQVDVAGIKRWMREVRSKPFMRCHWCGDRIRGSHIHFDHVIALSRGGSHTIGNLCCACRFCNSSKHDRLPSEWNSNGQSFLPI